MTQFMATGQRRVAPWHTNMIFFNTPGAKGDFVMPNPTALASNVFNVTIGERRFGGLLFKTHVP